MNSEEQRSRVMPLKASTGEIDTASGVPKGTSPASWIKGQLLDLRRFKDGSYKATLLGEEIGEDNYIEFESSYAAQQFVSHWYLMEQR